MSKPIHLSHSLLEQLPFLAANVEPTPLHASFLITTSPACAQLIELPENPHQESWFKPLVSGELLPEGGRYYSHVYAGHQFGQFVPQLGDGRAISLGEVETKKGIRYEIQLKGAGLTPYSRMGDGRAVLRSSIREYLASEAMAALGIPTTRALSLVGSKEPVYRETVEQGAMVARVAQSHIRFGHFEYWFHQGKKDELQALADYCIEHYDPEAAEAENPYLHFFEQIVQRTAQLIAKWQAHGFAHGVMNTDNMSILGLTIDYGPFGFLDDYDPKFICNHSDSSGRYAFEEQPSIGLWNLNALALTFTHWLSTEEITNALKQYEPILIEHYLELMANKLGISQWRGSDQALLGRLLSIMAEQKADYSLTFRLLNLVDCDDTDNQQCQPLLTLFACQKSIKDWLVDYRTRLKEEPLDNKQRILIQNSHNALYILRNYLAELAIKQAENGCYQGVEELFNVLQQPFTEQAEHSHYAQPAPHWGKALEISCSS